MIKVWFDKAWEEYVEWQSLDKKLLKRLNDLLKEIERNPFSGKGKPEPLKGDRKGFWSRRLDDYHRIVYKIEDGKLHILQCFGHYDD